MKLSIASISIFAFFTSFGMAQPYLQSKQITFSGNVSTQVPWGAAIPEVSAGTEIGNITYTPTWGKNKLIITVQVIGGCSAATVGNYTLSLCQDGVTNVLARTIVSKAITAYNTSNPIYLTWVVDALDVSPKTFRLKLGSDNGSSYIVYGGGFSSYISIQEVPILQSAD